MRTLAPFLDEQVIGRLNRVVVDNADTYGVGMSSIEDAPTAPKAEHSDEESFSESSPEIDEQNFVQEVTQVQKRKGGRKPIYATSEERKQRNRQAQAAFRERRTEYIKQLETTIKHNEDTLQSLQQSHRSAADECLMLRYKNSLLERILLEKGIDVQAELKSKTDTTHMPPSNPPHSVPQPSPQQRAVMNRHNQARRPASGSGLKILNPPSSQVTSIPNKPPQLQPNAPRQIQSPLTAKSPVSLVHGGMASPGGDRQAQQQPQPQRKPRSQSSRGQLGLAIPTSAPNMQAMSPNARGGGRSNEPHSASGNPAGYYPSLFQTHIEQLGKLTEQEYDAHADMLDDQDPSDHSAGPGPYPQPFDHQPLPPGQQLPMGIPGHPPMQPMQPMHPPPTSQPADPTHPGFDGMNQLFDPFDPMLDADPFGLTASMHFPTQFTFQESSMR